MDLLILLATSEVYHWTVKKVHGWTLQCGVRHTVIPIALSDTPLLTHMLPSAYLARKP